MTINQRLKKVAHNLQRGNLAISEAESLMDEIIRDEIDDIDSKDPNDWISDYHKLKRKSWRLLLEATKSNH